MAFTNTGVYSPFTAGLLLNSGFGYTSLLMDAAGEQVAQVFRAPATATLTSFKFRLGTVTTGQTLRGGLYTVDSSGNPTTTPYGSMAVGTVTVADGDDNAVKEITLATPCSMTAGDRVALVLEWDSTAGNLNIQQAGNLGVVGFPYAALYTTSWAKQSVSLALELNFGGVYYNTLAIWPWVTTNTTSGYNSGTGTNERATKWSPTVPSRLCGIVANIGIAAGADFDFVCYDGLTVKLTKSHDGDVASGVGGRIYILEWDSTEIVMPGESRYLALRPTTANSLTLGSAAASSADAREAILPGMHLATRAYTGGAGAWTDDTTATTTIIPLVDQFDDGSSTAPIIQFTPSNTGSLMVFQS